MTNCMACGLVQGSGEPQVFKYRCYSASNIANEPWTAPLCEACAKDYRCGGFWIEWKGPA